MINQMPKNRLPNEILLEIFKQLKYEEEYKGSLAECALTCRQWKQPAQAALYSTLTITSTAAIDAILDKDLRKYVQSINYLMEFSEQSMIKIAFHFEQLINFRYSYFDCSHLMENMLHLLQQGGFPVLQTLPSPDFDGCSQRNYEACLEIMKDRITEITLTVQAEESDTFYSLREKLDSFPKLNTIRVDLFEAEDFQVWEAVEAVSSKDHIKTLFIRPSLDENFSFDAPITPEPDVKTLDVDYHSTLNSSFISYVMKKLTHLRKLNMLVSNYIDILDRDATTENPDAVLVLEYLYSIQNVTEICLVTEAKKIKKHLLSLLRFLDEKQLQDTTFTLAFNGGIDRNGAAVINFTRSNSRSRIHIRLQRNIDWQFRDWQLMKEVGSYLYRLHLEEISEDLGKILNMVSTYCPRLNCLLISHGGDSDSYCSPSDEAIAPIHTVKRLIFRNYGVTSRLLTLIYKQFPCLEDLVLYGFSNWKIPGTYFSLVSPFMSISYFRLCLNLYTEAQPFLFKKVFIKLETMEQETRYYDLNSESPEYVVENYLHPHINFTEAAYQESIDDDSYMTFFIKCKSVAKFVPTFSPSILPHTS